MIWGVTYCVHHPPEVKQININRMLKHQAQIQLRNHPNERQINQHQRNILTLVAEAIDKFNIFT